MNFLQIPRFVARSLLRRVAITSLCAAIAATALVAQSPFSPALERQLWKTLLPMGGDLAISGANFVPIPQRVSVNTPSPFKEYSWTDENGEDIYRSVTIPSTMPGDTPAEQAEAAFNAEVDLLRDQNSAIKAQYEGVCTFSHRDDWDGDGPQWRQCVSGGRMLPPPPGALLDPVGLAVDGTTIYVVDDLNQRVQAFDFDGRVKPMKYPIGSGIPGDGTYNYANYFPYASFTGYKKFDGGYSGSQLSAPNGIAVDAAHRIVVADSGNYRLAVFNNDGSAVFNMPMPEHLGVQTKPTLVALTPGSTVLAPNSPIPAGHENDRIVVTDWSHCVVHIYKSNFELVKSLPETLPAIAMHDACKSGDPTPEFPDGTPTFDGEFSTVTGVTIDQAGHIYVTDHGQNVAQVFDANGNTLGWIGKPGVQAAPGELMGPVGVAVDHLGRVGVIDGGNSRVVFYTVTYSPENVPAATFEFQLDTVVSVSDFPMGLVEQWGTAAQGLDPKGRFLATDPWGKQILRFELPELGIVDAQASLLTTQPPGQPEGQLTGRGTFKVVVPRQKESGVQGVETSVVPVEAGVSVVAGSLLPSNNEVPPIDIGVGEYVAYQFTYTMLDTVAQATFKINARGDFNGKTWLAQAPESEAQSHSPCTGCDARHEIYWLNQDETPGLATPTSNPTTGAWYPEGVFVRIYPEPAVADVTQIGWYYAGASEVFYTQHGELQETSLDPDGHIDVPVGVAGASTVTYWAITSDGRIGPPHVVDVNVDPTPPSAHFLIWPPFTGTTDVAGQRWYNHDVTTGYTVSDPYSGTDADTQENAALADGTLTFTSEGRNQSQSFTATDRVGHSRTFDSTSASGGRPVNIDKVAPHFDQPVPNPIVVQVTGEDEEGAYAILHPDTFNITASDPPLSTNEPGSGVASVSNPGGHLFRYGVANSWTYTAVDHAGNAHSETVTVIVEQVPATIGVPDQFVGYGGRLTLRANVTPRSAVGNVTFSFGSYTVQASVQQGEAVAVIDPVIADVAVYPLHVVYTGDQQTQTTTNDTATVTVQKKTLTVVADAKQKYFGEVDPPLTYTHSPLVGTDTLVANLVRVAGTAIGSYPIIEQSIVISPTPDNYSVVFQQASLTIKGRVTIAPHAKQITYGDPDPIFDFDVSDLPEGGVISTLPTCVVAVPHTQYGTYPITCAGATGNFLEFTYAAATLTVNQRPAKLFAGGGTKVFGASDPPLTTTQEGILAADLIGLNAITLKTTRAAGEDVDNYVTIPSATGGASANYLFTPMPGVFSITKAQPTIVLTGGAFFYDGATHPATCTVTGGNGAPLPRVVTYAPGGLAAPLTPGAYVATCSFAGDRNHEPISATASITISNNAPPFCGNASGGEIWPPNHTRFIAATVNGVTDPENKPVSIIITAILQDEEVDSTGDGQFAPDGKGVGSSTAWIRAERNGSFNKAAGDGRVYEIQFRATDPDGAYCTGSVLWTVPHDQGQRATAIDSGVRYDSTLPANTPGSQVMKQ
jgi:hypothetical protein